MTAAFDRAAWLAGLKVGDEVAAEQRHGFDTVQVIRKVEKIRSVRGTQVVTVDGFDYKNGTHRVDRFNFFSIDPLTDELRAKIKERISRSRALREIDEAKLTQAPTELLVAVAKFIRDWRERQGKGAAKP